MEYAGEDYSAFDHLSIKCDLPDITLSSQILLYNYACLTSNK